MIFIRKTESKNGRTCGIYKCPKCNELGEYVNRNVQRRKHNECDTCLNSMPKWSKSRLFFIYHDMKKRCLNKTHKDYNYYGGRGIAICKEWLDNSSAFVEWANLNGYSKNLTIDRIDNNGNYEPSNCRWVDMAIQTQNTRRIRSSNTSGYRGVTVCSKTGKYVASIHVSRKRIYIGTFEDIKVASKARDAYILENNLSHTLNNEGVAR